MSQNNKPQTWDEMVNKASYHYATGAGMTSFPDTSEQRAFEAGANWSVHKISSHPRVVELLGALEKCKSEFEVIAEQNDCYKHLVAWQMAKSALEKFNNGGIE